MAFSVDPTDQAVSLSLCCHYWGRREGKGEEKGEEVEEEEDRGWKKLCGSFHNGKDGRGPKSFLITYWSRKGENVMREVGARKCSY